MAKDRERVYSYIELNDGFTSIQKLSLMDQLRVMLKNITNDDAKELRRDDILTSEHFRLVSNLSEFIDKATEPIRRGANERVKLKIDSEFAPVIDEVLSLPKYSKYYKININKPKVPYNGVHYLMEVTMEVRRYGS